MRTVLSIGICGLTFMSGLVQAQQQPPTPDKPIIQDQTFEAQLEWRKALVEKPVPAKGCFKVEYPSQEWVSTPCVPLPANLLRPSIVPRLRGVKRGTPEPHADAGNGVDYVTQATSGTIVTATGSFPSVKTTGEINVSANGITSRKNQFSLQLNSNLFNTRACIGSMTGQCQGWEQFVLSNDPGSPPGYLWIQFWLLDYGTPCPQGWGASGSDCSYNGKGTDLQIIGSVQSLKSVWMKGIASAGNKDPLVFPTDTVLIGWTDVVPEARAFSADSVLDLASHWTQSEFNVFGDLTFHLARFNRGTAIEVEQKLTFANDLVPKPLMVNTDGTTGETNNLNLVPPPCVDGPVLRFMESNTPNAVFTCPKSSCTEAKERVAQDQEQLAKLQKERNGPTCKGLAEYECSKAVSAVETKLANDIAFSLKECVAP